METTRLTTTQPVNASATCAWDLLGWLLLQRLPQADLVRYSCPTCFETLWAQIEEELPKPPLCSCWMERATATGSVVPTAVRPGSEPEIVVIAYDDIPSKYARPSSLPNIHLDTVFAPTVLYFLLARKLAKSANDRWRTNPLRWIILDPHRRADEGTVAIAQLLSPYVQIIDGSEPSLLAAIERCLQPKAWDERKLLAAEEHLKLMVTAPGNRHAVSNVVGPVLLGFQPQEPEVHWIVSHLKQVLSSVGMVPAVNAEVMFPSETERRKLAESGPVEFVLIDDQHRNGWGQIVKVALGLSERAENSLTVKRNQKETVAVSIYDSAEFLVAKLEQMATLNRDQRFELNIGKRNWRNEVLLLDLRLFEGYSLPEEAKFFLRVLAIAERFTEREGLPWPGFSEPELIRLRVWLAAAAADGNAKRSDKVYLEVLTLLPRVLSLTDLSLPIVIFSSTGQREITERLKNYGNIITDFEKPRLFGYQSDDMLAQTRAAFWSAVDKALCLCRARLLCSDLLKTARRVKAQPVDRAGWSWARHLELYLDESGSALREADPDASIKATGRGRREKSRFVIAGVLVPYANAIATGARQVHEKMEQAGLRWWPKDERSPYLLKRRPYRPQKDLPGGKYRAPKQIVEDFLSCLQPATAAAICLEYSQDIQVEETDNVRLQRRGDNRYRDVLSNLLELVLFDLVPTLQLDPAATLSIFVATRYRSREEFKNREDSIKRHRELFGFHGDNDYQRYQTVEESSVLPILFEVLARRALPLGIVIEHARGVTLAYPTYGQDKRGNPIIKFPYPKWKLTRHQHYLADTIAGECYRLGAEAQSGCLQKLFEKGMYDRRDSRLATFMLATRMISRGEVAEALLAMKNSRSGEPLSPNSGAAIIFQKIARAIKDNFSGRVFLQLAGGLSLEKQSDSTGVAKTEHGMITSFDQTSYSGTVSGVDGVPLSFKLNSWESATFPALGGIVEFERSSTSHGKPTATRVRSIV